MDKNITQFLVVILLLGLTSNLQSQDLHDDSNAASVANEANAITGWTSDSATLTSESGGAQLGNFFLRLVSSATNGRIMDYSFNAVTGQDYTIRIWAREGAQVSADPQPAFAIWSGLSGFSTTRIIGTNWTEYVFNVTATSTTPRIRVYTGNSSSRFVAGNTVEVDNVSIVPVGGDTTPPSIVISSSVSSPTNTSPIPVTITFDEPVSGFVNGDLTVGNGSAGNFSGSGDTYTVEITPTTNGTVTVDIAAGVATDAVGNNNTAATQFSIDYDTDQPGVVISSSVSSPTNSSPIPVTITFDEPVSGFVNGDLTVGNGSAGILVDTGDGQTYTVDITPTTNGTVTVDIAAGVATDAADNNNTAATQFSIDYDTDQPGVVISSSVSSPTNSSPIPVTITFDEPVSGFVNGDLTVGNGSAGILVDTGDGQTYTVDITPTTEGTITVDVPANSAINGSGNGNTAAAQFSIDYDGISPNVVISSSVSSPTNTSPIPVTITFDEPVSGFVNGDLTVGNGSAGILVDTGDGQTYTVDITPTTNGTVTVDIAAGVATDAADNNNTAAAQFSIDYDGISPNVVISSSVSSPTNSSPIPVTITFDEPVSGFVNGDLTVGNGSAGILVDTGDGQTYTVDITPTTNGTVTVDIAAGVATDAADNNNTAATQFSIDYDTDQPGVVISSSVSSPTNSSPIPVTITFDEPVSGFVNGDLTVGNGSAGILVDTGDGQTYTVDITPTTEGTITVDVPANSAINGSGNGNTAAAQFSIDYDGISPNVVISSSVSSPTNTSPIPVTITFDEPVSGFVNGDLTVGNGSAGILVDTGDGQTYTVDITPTTNGTVTVDIAAGVAADAADNNNTAATQFSIDYDTDQPGVVISSSVSSPTNSSPIPVTITFDEPVSGFVNGDLTVGNGSAGILVDTGDGQTYTVDITPTTNGTVTVDIAAGVATDAADNNNTAATQFSIDYDTDQPGVVISSSVSSPTNSSPIPVTITFDEPVSGFVNGDLTVGNGSAGILVDTGDGQTYTVDITPTTEGTITVDVPANSAINGSGNGNTAAAQFSIDYDGISPNVVISSSVSSPTNTSPIPVTITFDEPVSGFVNGDLTVGNGSAGILVDTGDGQTYTVDITPTTNGTVTVDIAAGVATDAADNNNTAAAQFSIDYDGISPNVVISSSVSSPTNSSPIPVTITFDEPVSGFVNGDLTVGNGSAGILVDTGDGQTYTVDITPTTNGTVTVDIAAGVATDAADNNNTAATQFSIDYDTDQPGVVISSSVSSPTNSSPIPVTITFDEPVSGFVNGDLTVGNGSAGILVDTGDGQTYTVDITPTTEGTITVDVPANSAINGSGNGNTAAAQFSIDYDGISPNVVISSSVSSPTNTSPIPVTITFDEPVSGFVNGDLTVGNGSAGILVDTGDGQTYTVDITPTTNGTVTVDIAAGVATDAADNNNTAATQFSIDYDTDQPGVVISSSVSSPTNSSPIPVTITFDEPVSGFVNGDLTVGNGSAGILVDTGDGQTYTVDITPTTNGTVTVDIAAGVATDAADNNNTAATQFSIDYDTDQPGVVISSSVSSPTNSSPIPVTITFDEPVSGFVNGDLTVGNGSAGILVDTGDGQTYTVDITPTTEGTITVDIAAGVATDAVGNGNTAATQFSILYQTTDTQSPDAITDLSAFNITDTTAELLWTEPYDNFGVTDYEVFQDGSSLGFTGGAISHNVAGLSPETSYAFTVYAHDAAGNISDISNIVIVNTTVIHYTTANANLTTVDWRARDLFVDQNLGIGTTNTQGYRLAIAGNVIAESMKVELQVNWPDFVFNDSFELPSLEEVAQYIEDKGHLKGIPSAKEVRQTGIDLGDMNAKLLQKIEELTLYTIKQEMTLKALKEENKKIQVLTERLEALERRLEQK